MTRLSQRDRMYAALNALRVGPIGDDSQVHTFKFRQLTAPERNRLSKRLLAEKWTAKNFTRTRYTIEPKWRGDELSLLLELSHYLLPRAVWARRRESGGSWYRRELMFTLLALVQHKFGRDAGKQLRALFVKNGVKYRPRRIMTAAQKAELAKRSKFKKTEKVLDRALTQLATATLAVKTAKSQVAAVTGKRRIVLDD